MPRLHLVADVRRIDKELASQVNQWEQYGKSLLPATFDFCRKIYCSTRTGV